MSGFSGPTHQGLVGDGPYDIKKKKSTPSKPKDDVEEDDTSESGMSGVENRKKIDAGMEELVMAASHDNVFTNGHDHKHQDIINAIRKELIAFAAANGDPDLAEMYLDDGMESFAQFKETMGKVIKKIAQITVIILAATKEGLKKIAGRLNRLSVRNTLLRRRVQNSDSKLALSDEIPLPDTYPYITIKGKTPKTANDVVIAVSNMKDFFVCAHNTNAAFHTAFTESISSGTREDSIYFIKQFLGLLANRVGAKADNTGRMVYDNIPAGYGMVIGIGNSFSDCSASVSRVHPQDVKAPMTHRGDKATLLRILDNNEQFLKNINEVYGRISSRLDNDFRKNIKTAETKLRASDSYDGRAMAATLEWYGDNQNKIFTKSMQMSCSVLAASMDYIHNNVVKAGAGTEDFEDGLIDDDMYDLDTITEEPDVDESRIGLASAEAYARVLSVIPDEVMQIDHTMEKLFHVNSKGIPLVVSNSIDSFEALWQMNNSTNDNELIDVSDRLLGLRDGLGRLINTRRDVFSYNQLMQDKDDRTKACDLLFSHGCTRPDYHQFDLLISNQVIKPCENVYDLLKTHLAMLSDSFNQEDILLSNLVSKLTTVDNALWSRPIPLTGQCMVSRTPKTYGITSLSSHSLVMASESKYTGSAIQNDPQDVDFRFNIDRCIKLHNQFSVLHAEYTDLYVQVNNVFNIIVSSLLTSTDRSWVSDAFTYLSILIGTVRWMTRLHNDMMDYLLSVSRQMIVKQKQVTSL